MKRSLLAVALLLSMPLAQAADEAAGSVRYMSGTLVAQKPDGTLRVLAPKSPVHPGELLVTGEKSYAQVTMNDGTKMTLRPQSNLKIETYQFKNEEPKADSAVFRLLKGGFRTVTGLIGKRGNKDAYSLRAAGATIGIRGTDFSSRLCATKDCADDEAVAPTPAAPKPKAVGRVMRVQGALVAKEADGNIRKLTLGSPVFEGDILQSDAASYAVVAFRDGGRITLQEKSVFQVEAFKYDKAQGQENIALRLIKGGVRVVTGLIGRVNHDNYQFKMSGATIGIRGTGFDAWCNGPCAEGKEVAVNTKLWAQYAALDAGDRRSDAGAQSALWNQYAEAVDPLNGAGVYVWQGEVVFAAGGSSFTVALNQAATLARETGKPIRLMAIPASVINNDSPRPDTVDVDFEKLFEEGSAEGGPGLYVTVHDGQVILSRGDQSVDLGKGESGFTSEQILTRLKTTPGFMRDNKLENLEQNDDSGGNRNGCVIL